MQSLRAPVIQTAVLPGGLRVRFIKGTRRMPRDSIALPLSHQREIDGLAEFEDWARGRRRESKLAQPAIGLWNNGGSWLQPAAWAATLGFSTIYVCQAPALDELDTDSRIVLTAAESDLCFVPNYKCAYSSMRHFYIRAFPSCAVKNRASRRSTAALNERVHLERHPSDFKFSFVRDPADRFASFYLDKLCRGEEHANTARYRTTYEILIGTAQVAPTDVLQFIGSIPATFADRHWKSTWANLFMADRPLVHRIYSLDSIDRFLEDVSLYLRSDVELPHSQSSRDVAAAESREALADPTFQEAVREAYARDMALYMRVLEADGALRFR